MLGRDSELAALGRAAAVGLVGEPGIGKSTIWNAFLDLQEGRRILRARPAESEAHLAYAGLSDLFEDVDVTLSAPQQRAFDAARLREPGPVDERALGVAVRSALLQLQPVVVAIDDAQWLDAPSAEALVFAIRRLADAQVQLVWTCRTASPLPGERIEVTPLDEAAIHKLLPKTLPPATKRRIYDISGGNPFYALELARAGGRVPGSLEALVKERLAPFTGEALALLSTHPLTLEQLDAAGIPPQALDAAIDAKILEGTRFTHPLLASVVYHGLSTGERRDAHRRVAEVVDHPLAQLRHLALATDRPDEQLAQRLEDAGLFDHALRLTPAHVSSDRRAAAAARAHLAAGDREQARTYTISNRAEALLLEAEIEADQPARAIALLESALQEPGAPRAAIHRQLSELVRFTAGLDAAAHHARKAVEFGDSPAGLALIRFNAGEPDALQLAEQAGPSFALAHILTWSGHHERAEALLKQLHEQHRERDERLTADALWYLAIVELRTGRLTQADTHAEQALEVTALYGDGPPPYMLAGLTAAHVGDLARARRRAERCRELAENARLQAPHGLLGLIDLWSGDADAAVGHFERAERITDAADGSEPSMSWWRAEQVEALLRTGRVADAELRLDAWEAAARRLNRTWVLEHAHRCRALVRGEPAAIQLHDSFGQARAQLAAGIALRRARQKRASRENIQNAIDGFDAIGAAGWAGRARSELSRIGGRTRSEGLTPAEQRVATLVAAGHTNKEVAALLFLGERTVEAHLTHIYAKLDVRSRTELGAKFRDPHVSTPDAAA